ncbi:hypothetical protein Tco_1219775 [Tanacetum coccineum]
MITNNNRIEGKKLLGLMLPPQLKIVAILEAFPCVRNVPCITQDLVLLSVRLATRERTLQEPMPKSKQRCIWDSILAEGQERSPRPKHSYGSFDIVIGMDWLSKYHARIICDKKVVHIPIDGETLIIRVFIDDILIYSRNKEEHANQQRIILELLRKEKLYAKFSKCDFWINIVQFLGHVIDNQGIHVDPAKIEAVKNWESPTTPTEVHQFLGLAGYYQRFIEAQILALREGNDDFVIYYDASLQGLGAVFANSSWEREKVVADALSQKERIKPLRVRSLVMTLHPKLPSQILEAQTEAIKEENIKAKNLRGMDKAFEDVSDGTHVSRISKMLSLLVNERLIMHKPINRSIPFTPSFDKK